MSPDDPRHGTTRGYHSGCRCKPCKAARAKYEMVNRHRRHNGQPAAIDATGAQRRIQALMAIGYTGADIAREFGWTKRNRVHQILNGQKGKPTRWVERKTHQAIADLFERWAMHPPEMTKERKRCRTIALNKGYAPPLAWDDIDDPDEQPKHNTGGQRDTLAEFEHLTSLGVSRDEALKQLGVSWGAIDRAMNRQKRKEAA